MKNLYLIIFCLFVCLACTNSKKTNKTNPVNITDNQVKSKDSISIQLGKWTHSREEDSDGVKVFRPSSYKLPPSRGRVTFILKENGELEYMPLAANDLHQFYPGTWSLSGNKLTLKYQDRTLTYSILESSLTILKLQ